MMEPESRAACFVFLWAAVAAPFSLSLGGSARFILDEFSRSFLVFVLIAVAVRNVEDVRRLMATFCVGVSLFAAMAPVARYTGFGHGGYDPNDGAMFIVSGIPVVIFFALFGRRSWVRISAFAAVFVLLGALLETQSRGGFLALMAVGIFLVVGLSSVRRSLRIGFVVIMLAAAVPMGSSDYWQRMETIRELDDGYGAGVGGRRNLWGRAIGYGIANPITGIGANQFTRAERLHPTIRAYVEAGGPAGVQTPHSMWFQTLAELGIPGFAAFVATFLLCIRTLRRMKANRSRLLPMSNAQELVGMAEVLIASLIGLMVAGSFLSNAYRSIVWAVLGIAVGLSKVQAGRSPLTDGGRGSRVPSHRTFHPHKVPKP